MAVTNPAPGIYTEELDFSQYTTQLSSAIYGVVGTATKGDVNTLTFVGDASKLKTTFGPFSASAAMDEDGVRIGGAQGLYQMDHYLSQGSNGWFVRVAGPNLAYASLTLTNVSTYYGAYSGATDVLTITAITPGTWANDNIGIRIVHVDTDTYNLFVYEGGVSVETYYSCTQATVESKINGVSSRITVEVEDSTQIPGETLDQITARPNQAYLDDGDDGIYASTQGSVSYPHIKDATDADTIKIVSIREGVLGNSDETTPTSGFYTVLDETTVGLVTYLRIGCYYDGSLISGEQFLGVDKAALITAVNAGSNWINLVSITDGLEPDASVSTNYYLYGGLRLTDVIGTQSGNTITGLQIFRNSNLVDINILAAPGQYHRPVLDELVDIAESRGDTIALLATPFDLSVDEVIDWHNGDTDEEAEIPYPPITSITSSYATTIFQWVRFYDSDNGVSVWTSSEGADAATMAKTDSAAEPWFANAGMSRGYLPFIEDITYSPAPSEQSQLYGDVGAGQNAVNYWLKFRAQGIRLWGQRTLQRTASSLDRVNVRRLLNILKKTIATSSLYLVFDPNDATLWNQWEMLIRPFMKSVQARRGVTEWDVRMDGTTTTSSDIDNNTAVGRIFIQPTKAAERIILQFIITSAGVSFDELFG